MKIQKATALDVGQILSLLNDLAHWLKSKGIHQWATLHPREVLEQEIVDGEVFVYKENETVIGSVTLTPKKDPYWDASAEMALYIHRLAIKRSHAGRQLGRDLVAWAEAETRRRGIPLFRLDCHSENLILRNYYQSLGFQFLGVKYESKWDMEFALFEKRLTTASSQNPD